MILTSEQLKKILPLNKEVELLCILLNKYLPLYDISSKDRVVMFLSQCSHESNQFTVMRENLNYSADGLLKIFPKYFNQSNVYSYARNPKKIASRVYANRMGNGDEESMDGWTHRGFGFVQVTGKSNQTAFALFTKKSIKDILKYIQTTEGALEISLFWWKDNQLNSYADARDIRGATKRINGGILGITHRIEEYERIYLIL